MSRTETIVDTVAITVMLFGIFIGFIGFIGYIGCAVETADTIILRGDGQSYACRVSGISPAPHNCKPVKEKQS